MFLRRLLPVIGLVLAVLAHAEERPMLISKGGKVPLWLAPDHPAGEAPLHNLEETDLVSREDTKGDYILVVTKSNIRGWVEAARLRPYDKPTGTTINLNDIKVDGKLDNPSDVYILTDDSKIPPEGFFIVRDMTAMILSDPIDRETLERKNQENF